MRQKFCVDQCGASNSCEEWLLKPCSEDLAQLGKAQVEGRVPLPLHKSLSPLSVNLCDVYGSQ